MKKLFSILCVVVCLLIGNMNFATNATTTVTFTFDGLQALAFGDSSKVTDGILNVIHHTPKIEIKTIEQGKVKSTQTITDNQLKNQIINISLPNKSDRPTRYNAPDMQKDAKDFRWCLDMESDLFQKQLYLKDNFFTKIRFNVGEFYTASISPDKYQFFAGSTKHSFNRQIGTPGASVKLSVGQSLNISGLAETIILPYAANTSYEIAITNLPPKDMMDINHFAFYYDLIKSDVPKFMPVMVQKSAYGPYPFLCGPVGLGKSVIK